MRFTYAEAMIDPAFYVPLAQAAEEAGYHSMTLADSLAYPRESDSTYPYTATGDREFLDGKPFIEPLVLAAALAPVTSTLRLVPFVLKLAIRQPALVAKQAMSVAVLSGDRLGLGVGLSPWPEDFALMGVGWERRGKRMDEQMDICGA
jgi:alkanesulfonate monooxygenase SsuD/methylene tetrahydromethanopterin reductase-like flavin-dependent oxidoreductase (luciferase family)